MNVSDNVYSELNILGRQYSHYITMRIESKLLRQFIGPNNARNKNLLKKDLISQGKIN